MRWSCGRATRNGSETWQAVEDLVRLVKQEDPRHPVIVVTAGINAKKLAEVKQFIPSIDALGINSYSEAANVPGVLATNGWDGPYLITEFGPRGYWEVETTPWGLPIEDDSSTKMRSYLAAYQGAVEGQPNCLGSYVFYWAQKQERTHTWFGMFLPDEDSHCHCGRHDLCVDWKMAGQPGSRNRTGQDLHGSRNDIAARGNHVFAPERR